MLQKTHILGGIAAGLAVATSVTMGKLTLPDVGLVGYAAGIGAAIIGSLLPDIDLMTSTAGKTVKPVSFVMTKLFGHRTITHGLFLWLILFYIGKHHLTFAIGQIINFYFFAGILSHLILDSLNKKGIPIFWPDTKHYHLAKIKAGGKGEKAFQWVLFATDAIFMIAFLLCLLVF